MKKYNRFLVTLLCLSFSLCNIGCVTSTIQDVEQISSTIEDTVMFKINVSDDEYIYTDDPYDYYTCSEQEKTEQFYVVESDIEEAVNFNTNTNVSESKTSESTSTNEPTKSTTDEVKQVEVFTTSEEHAVIEDNNFVILEGSYVYCPSSIVSGSDISTFYCSNSSPWVIRDDIYYSKLICNEDGSITFKNQKTVLEPTANSWDSVHVCDPSVVSGSFNYDNNHYKYLMAYLGRSTTDSQQNNIGLAVSNSLDCGWVKVGTTPFISNCYQSDRTEFQWGVGQPSVIYQAETGHTLLFYTEGTYNLTCTKMQEWDLSNLDNPVLLSSCTIPNTGTNDFISNADFAFSDGILYMVCDTHPFGGTILNCVPDASCVYFTIWDGNTQSLSSIQWEKLFTVSSQVTGFSKNHNCGLYRNSYGGLAKNGVLVTSASEQSDFLSSLYTYRLRTVTW